MEGRLKLVVIDVGNTSTAVGLWCDGRVTRVAHCDGGFAAAAEKVRALDAAAGRRARDYAGLAYLSVVPKADGAWRRFARQELRAAFRVVDHRLFARASGLALDYPRPETIGADRLADAAAAADRYGAPVVVCDFGTAFTAAVVTRDRVWRGGVIAPGFPLMRDYLYERTAMLPRLKLGGRCPKIGRSTEEAMRFGAIVGYRGMVREIAGELAKNFKESFRLVATGGFAHWALKDSGLDFTIDPTLTLHGAALLVSRDIESGSGKTGPT